MSQSNIDPIEQLEQIKNAILDKIDETKQKRSDAMKEKSKINKLELELHPDKPIRLAAKEAEIKAMSQELRDLKEDLKNLTGTEDDHEEEQIQAALLRVKQEWIDRNPSAVYLTQDKVFLFIEEYSQHRLTQNVQIRKYADNNFHEFLANVLKVPLWHLPIPRLKKLYMDHARAYDMMRYSLHNTRWRSDRVYLPIHHLREYFIDRFELTAEEKSQPYNPFFDVWMHSLSGGKAENREHIERWIVHKVKNYHKVQTTPDIVIVGQVGGNGKGIFQTIMRLILPAQLVGKANSKTLNSGFNLGLEGKLVVFFDDQSSKEIDLDTVKQMSGADVQIIEPKGRDQYEAENTHNSAWFANQLPFPLTPDGQEGGVDRRWSVMRTNVTFLESIQEFYKTQGLECSITEAKSIAEQIVPNFLLNRAEVAKWFYALCERYSDIDDNYTLQPLHGEDYNYFLKRQQDSIKIIFNDLVKPIVQAGYCVPVFAIVELLRLLDNNQKNQGDKTIVKRLLDLGSANRCEMETDRPYLKIVPSELQKTKRCTVLKLKGQSLPRNPRFDWGLISNKPYGMTTNGVLIQEDDLIFGDKPVRPQDLINMQEPDGIDLGELINR